MQSASRSTIVLALAAAGALTLSACGGGGGTKNQAASAAAVAAPADSGSLTLLYQSSGNKTEPMDEVIAAFEKKYPDIKVKAEYLPIGTSYADSLRTRLRGGNQPDVFYAAPGGGGLTSLLNLADAGLTADLAKQSWTKGVVDTNARELFYQDGGLWGVPFDRVVVAQVYNTTALKNSGIEIPRTMDELLAACKKVNSQGKSLLSLAGANAENSGLFASALAANYVLADQPKFNSERAQGKTTFAGSKGWQNTTQAIVDMKKAGCFQKGAEAADIPQAAPALAQGKALSFVIPTGALSALRGIEPSLQLEAHPLPGVTAEGTNIYSSQSDALAISTKGAKNGAATTFLQYVATGGGDEVYAKATGNLPLKGMLDDPALSGLSGILADEKHNYPMINLPWPNPEVYNDLGKGVQGLLTGQQSPADVLKSMDGAWQQK
ncbi:ABC transporter substrate-binding protein [Streptomyces sp. NPDC002144]